MSAAIEPSQAKNRSIIPSLTGLLLGVILLSFSVPVHADCMRDRYGHVVCDRGQCMRDSHGVVYCSRYQDGAAIKNRYGNVVCGKGECVKSIKGAIICSARSGGAAMKDRYGRVVCEGSCERASVGFCGQGLGTTR